MCLTGNGTTFVLTAESGGATPPVTIGTILSIGGWNPNLTEIEDSDIETTGLMEYCAGDIISHEPLEITLRLDPNIQIDALLDNVGIIYVGTLTFQLPVGETTPASLEGSGYIVGAGFNGLVNNERSEATLRWRWDNKSTPLAFTAAA